MGLDMYLFRTEKIDGYADSSDYADLNRRVENDDIVSMPAKVRTKQIGDHYSYNTIFDEVGYWRKANAIHRWFVENVQNGVDECQYAIVTPEHLKALMDLVAQVLNDHSRAAELLPTQPGFFFGSTNYDEWYFEDIANTRNILEKVLLETKWDSQVVLYHSAW